MMITNTPNTMYNVCSPFSDISAGCGKTVVGLIVVAVVDDVVVVVVKHGSVSHSKYSQICKKMDLY